MLKNESVQQMTGKFVDPTEQFKKIGDFSSILPDIRSYQASKTSIKCTTMARKQLSHARSIRPSSRTRNTTKKKTKILPSVFMRLSTIPRPDVLHCYLSHADIMQYLDYLKVRFVDFVKIHTLGLSYERRPIKCIEINWNTERNLWAQAKENRARSAPVYIAELKQNEVQAPEDGRNIVFIEGGTHAREWISVTVALNCIYQLTEKNNRHRNLLRNLKFYIVPVVNPDGYEYTRNVNPRWRKNRRPTANGEHVGTDCNRNFDFHWEECRSKAKRNTYQGEKPFSEPETKALATFIHQLAPKLLFFLSLHSYAQCIMYPWGYSKLLPKNAKLMESVAMAGRKAIKQFSGRYYRVGSIAQITKRTIAGSVVDYAYGVVKIPLTLVMELPANEYGFQPPSDKINPLGNESWHGIREMCLKAHSLKAQIHEEEKSVIQEDMENLQPVAVPSTLKEENGLELNNGATDNLLTEKLNLTSITAALKDGKSLENPKIIKPQFNIKSKGTQVGPKRLLKGYIASMLDIL